MDTCSNQTGNMRHVNHNRGTDHISNASESFKVKRTRIRAGTDHNQLWVVLFGKLFDFIIVNHACFLTNAIRNNIEKLAGKINRRAVGQVAAVGKVHPQDRIARFTFSKIDGHIGL